VTHDVVVLGRAGVDLYPTEARVPLAEQDRFERFLGGTGANIAVGAARAGLRAALVTGVGDDGHGEFVRRRLAAEGVDVGFVSARVRARTPLTFCELWPPDRFPVTTYRCEHSPDWDVELSAAEVTALSTARAVVATGLALAREPSSSSVFAVLGAADGLRVLDLDWRPVPGVDVHEVSRTTDAAVRVVDVVVGDEDEVRRAGGVESLAARCPAVVLKRGPRGATVVAGGVHQDVRPFPVRARNGLGAGDAFAAALVAGLLAGRSLHESARRGAAAGALVAARLACADAMPTPDEVDALLAGT